MKKVKGSCFDYCRGVGRTPAACHSPSPRVAWESVKILICSSYFKTRTRRPVLGYENLPQSTTKRGGKKEVVSFHKAKCSQSVKLPFIQFLFG